MIYLVKLLVHKCPIGPDADVGAWSRCYALQMSSDGLMKFNEGKIVKILKTQVKLN